MFKLLNLEPYDIVNLCNATEHYMGQQETADEEERLQIIYDYLHPLARNKNLRWELHVEEIMPQTADNVLNYLVKQLKEIEQWGSDEYVFMENQFWLYLDKHYSFNVEEHDLDRAEPEVAQRYAILHIASKNKDFYDEGRAFE